MAAPTPVTRQEPGPDLLMLRRGFKCKITLGPDPDLCVWEKTLTLPGWDLGDKINTTTFWNEQWRTYALRLLAELTDSSFQFGYHPSLYERLNALRGLEMAITLQLPNFDTICFWGGILKIEFEEMSEESDMPMGTMTLTATMTDPDTGEEEDMVYTQFTGTGT